MSRSVSVEISPSENNALPGENLSFTITVRNDGNVTDNYKIENFDSQGWKMSLSRTEVSVNPGDFTDVSLQVEIPPDATGGTEDNITVTATSTENAEIKAENSCLAKVTTDQSVEVSVSPSEDNAPPGYTLNYEVMVTNTGNIPDNYSLTVVDDVSPSWSPSLNENLLLNVAPGENRKTTLEVTIEENADIGVEDNIVTTAVSQENAQVSDNARCIALSVDLVRDVRVNVSPSMREGTPGSSLTFSVSVKNEGNVFDNYELDASDDIVPSWNPILVDNLMENVSPGEERTTELSIKIPENNELFGVTDNATVSAFSLENAQVSDNAVCSASCVKKPVGGIFYPVDVEDINEQSKGNELMIASLILLPISAIIFGVVFWWRKSE